MCTQNLNEHEACLQFIRMIALVVPAVACWIIPAVMFNKCMKSILDRFGISYVVQNPTQRKRNETSLITGCTHAGYKEFDFIPIQSNKVYDDKIYNEIATDITPLKMCHKYADLLTYIKNNINNVNNIHELTAAPGAFLLNHNQICRQLGIHFNYRASVCTKAESLSLYPNVLQHEYGKNIEYYEDINNYLCKHTIDRNTVYIFDANIKYIKTEILNAKLQEGMKIIAKLLFDDQHKQSTIEYVAKITINKYYFHLFRNDASTSKSSVMYFYIDNIRPE